MFFTNANLGQNTWWRYLVTILLVLAVFIAAHAPLFVIVMQAFENADFTPEQIERFNTAGNLADIGIGANVSLLIMLIPFSVALCALLACVRFIHKRPVLSVLRGRGQFDMHRVLWGAMCWIVFAGIVAALVLPADKIVYQFELNKFLPIAVIALLLIPLQVTAEEVLFRGYLLQAIARFIRLSLVVLLVTTILFLLPHLSNPEFIHGFGKVAPFYSLLGAMFGALTILDDGLELPIGVHLGNNLFAAILVSTHDGAINTPSIFQTGVEQMIDGLPWLIIALVATFAALHWRFRFDWTRLLHAN